MNQTQKKHSIEELKSLLKKDLNFVEELLHSSLIDKTNLTSEIADNIFASGGKRIRPILTILVAKLFSLTKQEIYHLAAAIELIHTATLLHDDVIDESELRRGKKTAHSLFGNKASILVGDVLFSESFKQMVKSNSLIALQLLAHTSSIIAEGEVTQLEAKKNKIFSFDSYLKIVTAKTAELFSAAAKAPALLASRNSSECKIIGDFGLNLGIAFQMTDDLLDYRHNSKFLGKNLGDDFFEQKITLPIILLFQQSDLEEQKNLLKIFTSETLPSKSDLNYILSKFDKHHIYDDCSDYIKKYLVTCLELLKHFPQNQAREMLESICYITIDRKF